LKFNPYLIPASHPYMLSGKQWELDMDWISIALASAAGLAVGLGLLNRIFTGKGIGWQFIRYTVIAVGLPVAGLLAYNDALTGEAATIIAGALGYAFGKSGETG
jgi:hypothetical protein